MTVARIFDRSIAGISLLGLQQLILFNRLTQASYAMINKLILPDTFPQLMSQKTVDFIFTTLQLIGVLVVLTLLFR